ncbi:MAG: YqaE/Pmp3 family membrane protein [Myxococcota bacterium]
MIATTNEDGSAAREGTTSFLSLILACWLPPVGVLLKRGLGVDFVVNLLLTLLLFWLPGMLHAAWVISHDRS